MKNKLKNLRNVAKMIVACLAVTALFSGCSKDDKENQPPTCSITAPENNTQFTTGESITVTVVAEDADGAITEVKLYIDNVEHSLKTVSPYNFTINAGELTPGTHTLKAVAKDNEGAQAEATVSIIIVAVPETEAGVVINGITWATRNIAAPGQFVESPEDAGMVYQWGSNVAWSNEGPLTASDGNNTWRNLSETGNTWTAAKNPCPTGWRLPTKDELQSLISAGHTYTDNYNETGIAGRIFGTGGNTIFLPAVNVHRGYVDGSLYYQSYNFSYYWSSTSHESDNTKAWLLYFNFNDSYVYTDAVVRASPFFIRCVKE